MSAINLQPEDLEALAFLTRDLKFDDAERRAALLEKASRDFNAVPGSGKTSLLAAKLHLLAKKWSHDRKGICVLSHTTVARDEIVRRLTQSVEGSRLLVYPHFIGTIHAFVNHFLALPMLRSLGQNVETVDNDVFAMQRFGDIDQKILSDEENTELLTFPRQGCGSISTSKRFGPSIASAVASVRMSKTPVIGEAPEGVALTLLLYATSDATKVIERFGQLAIEQLPQIETGAGAVKAMCARKSGEGKVEAGRHLVDYWPAFGAPAATAGGRLEDFRSLICNVTAAQSEATLAQRVSDVRRALLLILRSTGSSVVDVDGLRDARSLLRAATAYDTSGKLEALTRYLALTGPSVKSAADRSSLIERVFNHLRWLLPDTLDVDTFTSLPVLRALPHRMKLLGPRTSATLST